MYYIHIADPGFPDPPWAGVRRIGPFLTREEAEAQAASDAATGQGVALGVYEAEESDKGAVPLGPETDSNDPDDFMKQEDLTPVVTQDEIKTQAEVLVKEEVARQFEQQYEDDAALQSVLDAHGLTVDQLREEGLIS